MIDSYAHLTFYFSTWKFMVLADHDQGSLKDSKTSREFPTPQKALLNLSSFHQLVICWHRLESCSLSLQFNFSEGSKSQFSEDRYFNQGLCFYDFSKIACNPWQLYYYIDNYCSLYLWLLCLHPNRPRVNHFHLAIFPFQWWDILGSESRNYWSARKIWAELL